ncbi:uncharacterized protein OCT59_012542 [Rhizophagus irregularis]|uniref:Uncharacterized protein n=2 Tax=Rhizophagus irregularis TaxID=588596 RepID=U9TH45_RHIID|nr:hypothetical protein GLOIN_2v1820981 [Rhizophagus irregularis DAOM 181602=DAOM 197198]EXX68128.1 hypothetical protein RirG_107870 [Rhizophagus irregularis DAOM 197198w]UZO01443.1 hypothetical protein OCT59_012542 [Rhizophagus irregularis]POG58638.1 hypothetical protein GLOIN_2v1820981 [Rhizophagus irregularis DAOM 181602=DAOM 197198]CAG8684649.1 16581_t:CDS:1 [Rhizophagus irregularis]GBC40536.1 kinase-like domain-containing protein [Rhizophagus irregularis DAOM 181602=DAOM 197198]|eukprot:XP_025165504.1 hypothetical protein GLOIN_2v1820981 [Rhizophagus irregularis DAOM 181602=DAOM 197198]
MNVKKSTKYEIPLFKVPFPPELTVEEILSNRSEDRLKSRAPNSYFIYRLAFLKELRKRTNDNVPMTKISSYISSMWFNETTAVRDAYKNLSEQVENRLTEIRRKEKLVLVNESLSLDLQDNSPSGVTEYNNVVSPRHIPILSVPSYQLYDSLYPEVTLNVNSSNIQIPYSNPYQLFTPVDDLNFNPYQLFTPVDDLNFNHYQLFTPVDDLNFNHYQLSTPVVDDLININFFSIDSCFCEICQNNFIN